MGLGVLCIRVFCLRSRSGPELPTCPAIGEWNTVSDRPFHLVESRWRVFPLFVPSCSAIYALPDPLIREQCLTDPGIGLPPCRPSLRRSSLPLLSFFHRQYAMARRRRKKRKRKIPGFSGPHHTIVIVLPDGQCTGIPPPFPKNLHTVPGAISRREAEHCHGINPIRQSTVVGFVFITGRWASQVPPTPRAANLKEHDAGTVKEGRNRKRKRPVGVPCSIGDFGPPWVSDPVGGSGDRDSAPWLRSRVRFRCSENGLWMGERISGLHSAPCPPCYPTWGKAETRMEPAADSRPSLSSPALLCKHQRHHEEESEMARILCRARGAAQRPSAQHLVQQQQRPCR